MSKPKKESSNTAERELAQAPPAGQTPSAEAPPEDELTALRREVEALRDKNLRLMAESQNQHKRAQREQQEALRFAEAEFARDLLVLLDDLERTQESIKAATNVQAVADGVRMICEHFVKVLNQRQIEPIEALGKPFNPDFHEAISQQPSEEHPTGTVIQEIGRGYTMHERVLRPSRVIVSGGPRKDGPQPGEEQDAPNRVK